MRRPPSNTEPLLFDLPLDRPARDDETEPRLDQPPSRPPRRPHSPHPPDPPNPPASDEPARPPRESRQRAAPHPAQAEIAGLLDPHAAPAERERSSLRLERPVKQLGEAAGDGEGTGSSPAAAEDAGRAQPARVGIGRRLAAGAADLLVHVAMAVLALAGCRYLGVLPAVADWPAAGVFLLSFSFLYTVVPLAFWGHTLGMTWAGLTSQSAGGEPLSFDQTARRWLGALLTLVILGLPLLLAVGGRSLADRLSGSRTLIAGG